MTDDDIFEELCLLDPFPAEAVAAAEARYERLVPRMIAAFEAWIAATAVERALPNPLFLLFHLLGARSERRAYRTLALFLRQDPIDVEMTLGDATTQTAARVLAHVCDGDPAPLMEIVYDADADEWVRSQALDAIAGATRAGTIDPARAEALLRRVHDDPPAPNGAPLWVGWQSAIAALRLEALRPLVKQAFDEGRVPSWADDHATFEAMFHREPGSASDVQVERDLAPVSMSEDFVTGSGMWLREGDDLGEFDDDELAAIESEIEHLMRDMGADDPLSDGGMIDDRDLDEPARPAPVVDPWRKVGRNDPCPCGSGKKFKKCCGG